MNQSIFFMCILLLLAALPVPGLDDRFEPVPADHAVYAVKNKIYGKLSGLQEDELLPRHYIHSMYKFGHCTPQMMQKVCLRKTSNITFTDWQASQANYVYLLEMLHTQRFRFQCVVMKIMVARQFVFGRGRLPLLYCQGILRYVYLMTYQKIELHEFFFHNKLNMPATLEFEFYHGKFYHLHADHPEP